MSEQSKERLGMVFEIVKTVLHYGFIPTVLYLGKKLKALGRKISWIMYIFAGFSKGAEPGLPPLTIASLLWQ